MVLESASAKAAHARKHRDELNISVAEWLLTLPRRPVPMEKRVEPWGTGEEVIYVVGSENLDVPVEHSLRLGDAVANYRAALDHIAWELVSRAGEPARPTQVYFPIAKSLSEFTSSLPRKLPGVDPMLVSIIRRYQPFEHGRRWNQHPLWRLEQWAKMDKHRVLHVIVGYQTHINIKVPETFDNFVVEELRQNSEVGAMPPGTELLRLRGHRIDPTQDHGVKVFVSGKGTVTNEYGLSLEGALIVIDELVYQLLDEIRGVL